MAIYQIKLKGKERMSSYSTYRASSVQDTLKQFCDKPITKLTGEEYQLEDIEKVELLANEHDIDKLQEEVLIEKLNSTVQDLSELSDAADKATEDRSPEAWRTLESIISTIIEKSEQIYSLLGALFDMEVEAPERFRNESSTDGGKEKQQGSQRKLTPLKNHKVEPQ